LSANNPDYDVIVIGAGHNGLTAAAYLARAGLRVIVLEASPTPGGMLGTNAIFETAPDHLINEGGIQASLFRSSTIEADLELQRYGLRQIIADPFHVHLDPDGRSLAFWKDPTRTADELKYFSQKDARAWLKFAQQLDAAMDLALPFMNGHPTRPSGRAILNAIPVAARRRKDLQPLVNLLTRSHAEIITERFDTPLLRAALASMPPFCWMTQDGTAWALIYIGMCQRTNSARMAGGSGALPAAIQRSFQAHGGTVRLSARVEELLVDRGRISGVRLDGGEELREVGSGLLAFRAEVRPVEDAPEPQHGLQNVVVVDAEVINPGLGDDDRVLLKVGHPDAGHGETDDLVADRAHGGVRRDLQGCRHDVAVEHHVQILVDGDPGK